MDFNNEYNDLLMPDYYELEGVAEDAEEDIYEDIYLGGQYDSEDYM